MSNDPVLVPHNQEVVGDELTTLSVNYHWRKIIADLLVPATYRSFWSGSDADIDVSVNNALELIRDLYDFEPTGGSPMLQSACRVLCDVVEPTNVDLIPLRLHIGANSDYSYDPDGWLLGDDYQYLQCPAGTGGLYQITAQCAFPPPTGGLGVKIVAIRVRNSFDVAKVRINASLQTILGCSCRVRLAQNDQVQLMAYHNVGSMASANELETFLELARVAD